MLGLQGGPPVRKAQRALSWWCFNPGVLMADICKAGVHSVILTSGTLSPLSALPPELNTSVCCLLHAPLDFSPKGHLLVFWPSVLVACTLRQSIATSMESAWAQVGGRVRVWGAGPLR